MIIEVKSTKSDSDSQNVASRSRYELKEIKSSKMPLAFGAFLMGVAVYLKSAFPGWSSLPPQEEPDIDPDAPVEATGKLANADHSVPQLDMNTETAADDNSVANTSGRLLDLLDPAQFMSVDSPSIPLADLLPVLSDQRNIAALAVANDNGSSRPDSSVNVPIPPVDTGGNTPQIPEKPDDDDDDEEPTEQANRAPRTNGPVFLYDVFGCAAVIIALGDLLRNATDPDGDTLSIRDLTVSSGTLTQSGQNWLYDPEGLGPVTITYRISDGQFSILQTAHFDVLKNPPIIGTNGADNIVGTECADMIDGRDGDDNIDGRGGNDTIEGGCGNDHIIGGAGDDVLFGGAGNDIILGGLGNDHISGGSGNDRLFGEKGNDTVFGDAGNDQISGGEGDDLLFGGTGADKIGGDEGADRIFGEEGNDRLDGGAGDDFVSGGTGNDKIAGGAGNDMLLDDAGADVVDGGAGNDHIVVALDNDRDAYQGGKGTDTLDMSATARGVDVDLEDGTAEGQEIGTNTVMSFEIVEGGSGCDTLSGTAADETLIGNAGNDVLAGLGGDDTLVGGEGCDSLDGGTGDDLLQGGQGDDILRDGAGCDVVEAGAGNDTLVAAADSEDDVYDGGTGCDTLDYSAASLDIVIDLAAGTATGQDIGSDTVRNFESIVGGSGDDHFIVGSQAVVLAGGMGNDLFEFQAPRNDTLGTLLHEIIDFAAGDRVRLSKYDLFDNVVQQLENRFETVYGQNIDAAEGSIRYRHEKSDMMDRTIIEADLDRDSIYETTININGLQAFIIVENV
ncbi:cadherin-like domain-containing protein [Mesorhizobium sp. SB112]|uniref:calcium-binding protein n=1 Tax=Mesorhizobium sp. SB112 TaxID=3151853 RepID=UPI0032651E60